MSTLTQPRATDTATVEACDICTHPDAAHDDIARRYCKATMTSALSRGCICSPSAKL
jgi:hypothetical protein